MVGPPGLEPGTGRLWAGGSTNWAIGPKEWNYRRKLCAGQVNKAELPDFHNIAEELEHFNFEKV